MKLILKIRGLLIDDARLAIIILVAVVLAGVLSWGAHLRSLGGIILWLGLIMSLSVSVQHELRRKLKHTSQM